MKSVSSRSIWAVVVAALLLSPACGFALGSQGAADDARRNLVPVEEDPYEGSPGGVLVGPPSSAVPGSVPTFSITEGTVVLQDGSSFVAPTRLEGESAEDYGRRVEAMASAFAATGNPTAAVAPSPSGSALPGAATVPTSPPTTLWNPLNEITMTPLCQLAIQVGNAAIAVFNTDRSTPFAEASLRWSTFGQLVGQTATLAAPEYRAPLARIVDFVTSTGAAASTTDEVVAAIAAAADTLRAELGLVGPLFAVCGERTASPGPGVGFDAARDIPSAQSLLERFG